jgi:hypothetical protein
MIIQLISFSIGAICVGVGLFLYDYFKHRKTDLIKRTIKEHIKEFEKTHAKGIKIFGIVVTAILGLIILLNIGLFGRNVVSNAIGIGATIGNAKRIAGIIGVIIFIVVLVFNIIKGTFSISKFFGGFNIFAGGVQGKLIYYGILLLLGMGLWHQLTKATTEYNTDYKNNIQKNRDVYIDQSVGNGETDKCFVSIEPFGFTLLKAGCVKVKATSIIENKIKENSKKEVK